MLQGIQTALLGLRHQLRGALEALRQPPAVAAGGNGVGRDRSTAEEASASHLVLDSTAGLPLLPTLNGWLLGYPVAYLVRDCPCF